VLTQATHRLRSRRPIQAHSCTVFASPPFVRNYSFSFRAVHSSLDGHSTFRSRQRTRLYLCSIRPQFSGLSICARAFSLDLKPVATTAWTTCPCDRRVCCRQAAYPAGWLGVLRAGSISERRVVRGRSIIRQDYARRSPRANRAYWCRIHDMLQSLLNDALPIHGQAILVDAISMPMRRWKGPRMGLSGPMLCG